MYNNANIPLGLVSKFFKTLIKTWCHFESFLQCSVFCHSKRMLFKGMQ